VARFVWTNPANRGRRARALAAAVAFQLRGRLLKRRTLVRLGDHSHIWADLHRTGASKAVYANPPDHPEMLVWEQHLRPGDLFVDVGANVGTYSVWAADLGAEVIALEPASDTFALLQENMALNGYRARLIQAAVGATAGTVGFTSGQDCTNHLDPDGGVRVPLVALDDIVGHRTVDGMKIDIEGFEIEALKGARCALSEGRIKLLQLEWNDASASAVGHDRTNIAEMLFEFGYGLYRPDENGRLERVQSGSSYGPDVFAAR
jgi:FkbM family methyltransferase